MARVIASNKVVAVQTALKDRLLVFKRYLSLSL